MNQEIFDKLKKESYNIGILFLIVFLGLKIVFFKESLLVTLRMALSLVWLFIIPGYALMFYWQSKLGFMERTIVGAGLTAAIIGISSYYLGIMGINIKYHTIILPLILISIGSYLIYKKATS